ncbi:RICIN domain-containing protein [Kitasatospora sp. NPDC057015]|uniref:RICIN domain-containing protein n=1 Tax=Kitasatospora sp. NPDC057015 TaxID=3346001 RepID=UPI00363386C9
MTALNNQSAAAGTAVAPLQISATDSATGQSLTYTATGLPTGLTINSITGQITGTPTSVGTTTVTVTATDTTGASGYATFTWAVNPVLSGTHTLTTGGKALDDPNSSTLTGTQLITWSTNGGTNQNWVLTQQTDGSYQITNGLSSLCMDVSGNSPNADAQIIQWTCNGGTNQHWVVTAVTGGYTITSKSSGLSLTTASTSNGALVTQQTDTGSVQQRWTIN